MKLQFITTVCLLAPLTAPGQAPVRFSSYDPQVKKILSQMTLEEKVGQMTQADNTVLKNPQDIQKFFLGSVLSGGDSDPAGNSLQDWTDMYDRFQSAALKTRLAIPIVYGVDAVHGHNNVLGAVVFPHNIGLGCTRNPKLVEQAAHITAEEVRATGINWTFAPCIAAVRDERWGRTYEGFGEDPELAVTLGQAAVRGFQGQDLAGRLSVLACAKHYAGDGGTTYGTGMFKDKSRTERYPLDRGDVRMDEATFRKLHLPGYVTAIKAGVATIMPSYSSFNGEKCSGSRRLMTEILKNELGFEGFVISDWAAIEELPGAYPEQIAKSINAGMDMVMVPMRYAEFFNSLKKLVEGGQVPMSRIDDAVTRILRVKFAMGLMDPAKNKLADRSLQQSFGSAQHRAVARQAVRESLVLLQNNNKALPVSKKLKRIHVAGKNADDLGSQCGGWTISWQGKSGQNLPGGTTVLKAIKNTVPKQTEVTYSADGKGAKGADVAIVVIGEHPYAEMSGDRSDLSLAPEDLAAIGNARQDGVPVVAVLISGRPMIITDALASVDAFVAAWLPGTEGQGIADVLFGDYKPTGKLSHSWPRSMAQLPINRGDKTYDPLFPYGFGLSYR